MGTSRTPAAPGSDRRVLRHVPTLLLVVAGLAGAWLLWPTTLGGCTTLTIVSGRSMEPTYRTGDLVVSRCGEPEVGDVVVYRPEPGSSARVIHRVVGGDAAGWRLQGDGNEFVDPYLPTSEQVVGVAALHVPRVGGLLVGLTNPLVWASVLLVAGAVLAWPRGGAGEPGDGEVAEGEPGEGEPAATAAGTGGETVVPAAGGVR